MTPELPDAMINPGKPTESLAASVPDFADSQQDKTVKRNF